MSQTNNCNNLASGNPPAAPEEKWTELVNNLATFTAAASNLVQSLQQAIQDSKLQSGEAIDPEFLCACSKLSENIASFAIKVPGCLTTESGADNTKIAMESQTMDGNDTIQGYESKHSRKYKTLKPKAPPRRNVPEAFVKEKTEKLAVLKENLNITQKNMLDLEAQVAQLEKMYQDETLKSDKL